MNKQFDELKQSGSLPSPSTVGMRILELTGREDWAVEELVQTMQADPALCGRILRVANFASTSGARSCSTVEEAAMRLGAQTVRNVALGFTLITGNRSGSCKEFDYEAFWADALYNAVASEAICRVTNLAQAPEAYTCALLARVGELALATVHPQLYGQILTQVRSDPTADVRALENDAFGIDHDEIGMDLALDWGLPEGFGLAIGAYRKKSAQQRLTGPARDLTQVLALSRALADYLQAEPAVQEQRWPLIQRLREKLAMTPEAFTELCEGIDHDWKEWSGILDIGIREMASISEIEARATAATAEANKGGMLVLAVDDDPTTLALLKRYVEDAGCLVITATNGKQALALALDKSPQIIITDWMMPELDGIGLTRALRRYRSGQSIYVILLTAREDEEQLVEAFEAGADDYVTKPFRPRVLTARLQAGMRVIRLQQQVEEERRMQFERSAKLSVMTRKLREATMTDPLTKLPNRRYAMRRLFEEWAYAMRGDRTLSVIVIDIDNFKTVNDSFGHDAGDKVLVDTATLMQQIVRGGETCARIGGEEFLVICPDTDRNEARLCAERLRKIIEESHVQIGKLSVCVTLSLGVAELERSMEGIDNLLKTADQAVYEAKRKGRNRVEVGRFVAEARSA